MELFTQFPPTVWEKEAASNFVPAPIVKLPEVMIAPCAEAFATPEVAKSPAMLNVEAGMVFTPLPLKVK